MQDKLHLYFLFDLMNGGDLMDVLVAEARVVQIKQAKGGLGCCSAQVGAGEGDADPRAAHVGACGAVVCWWTWGGHGGICRAVVCCWLWGPEWCR